MRPDDRKRVSKAQQKARKDRIQEERIRQKYERQTPLVLDVHSPKMQDGSEQGDSKGDE